MRFFAAKRSLAPTMADEQGRPPSARIDHATLLAAAGRGPEGARGQREACRKVLAQVYRVVAAVLGPRSADVADVAQDAFVRVYRGIDGFSYDENRPGGPTAWINRIALHTALDHRAGLAPWERLDEAAPERAGDGEDPGSALDRVILAAALLERLDERHRAILILHYWNGETAEEIAATLSIPVGTVKTRMRAAHQKIKAYAEENTGETSELSRQPEPELVEA
jgi:RNA polymerase sigma-70 factor (ECF subfamily)